ncbi:hypothetical protein CROQUDRAFT_131800 [Cronartium quercuum f. sp. fusiforme G11]|uniref:Uncharacterized protein n=1 Tax=Cronartium quercuum f. sp. fusiforme G11 TaxID=708437 RepID=A0A9P6NMA5_9BASI|nr:hypothetical protein CROQUDRAFT_131800 [Cronartium quercuum f. sp. fusiforme G11]
MTNILAYASSATVISALPLSPATSEVSSTATKSVPEVEAEPVVLTKAEIEALRLYSASVKNFTYSLFENFKKELEQREKVSSNPSLPRRYPRRKSRPMKFPEGTGL